jgi:hypothetical protein
LKYWEINEYEQKAKLTDKVAGRKQRRKIKKVIFLLYAKRFALCVMGHTLFTMLYALCSLRLGKGPLFCG